MGERWDSWGIRFILLPYPRYLYGRIVVVFDITATAIKHDSPLPGWRLCAFPVGSVGSLTFPTHTACHCGCRLGRCRVDTATTTTMGLRFYLPTPRSPHRCGYYHITPTRYGSRSRGYHHLHAAWLLLLHTVSLRTRGRSSAYEPQLPPTTPNQHSKRYTALTRAFAPGLVSGAAPRPTPLHHPPRLCWL